jgi:hypothetical protein
VPIHPYCVFEGSIWRFSFAAQIVVLVSINLSDIDVFMNPHGTFRRKRTNAPSEDYVNDERSAKPASPARHLSPTIFFSTTAQSDLDQPWFHKLTSRDEAIAQLETSVKGAFIVRPSSQRSCYALSWLDESGVVRFAHTACDLHHARVLTFPVKSQPYL